MKYENIFYQINSILKIEVARHNEGKKISGGGIVRLYEQLEHIPSYNITKQVFDDENIIFRDGHRIAEELYGKNKYFIENLKTSLFSFRDTISEFVGKAAFCEKMYYDVATNSNHVSAYYAFNNLFRLAKFLEVKSLQILDIVEGFSNSKPLEQYSEDVTISHREEAILVNFLMDAKIMDRKTFNPKEYAKTKGRNEFQFYKEGWQKIDFDRQDKQPRIDELKKVKNLLSNHPDIQKAIDNYIYKLSEFQ